MDWYEFRGGPHDGLVAVAHQPPRGEVYIRGQELLDGDGVVIGRVVGPDELPAALQVRRTAVGGQRRPQSRQRFGSEQEWRRAVKQWALARHLVMSNRGRVPEAVYDLWRDDYGDPVIEQ